MLVARWLALHQFCPCIADDLLKNDPVFIRGDEYYLSRQEAFDRMMEISLHAVDIAKQKELDFAERYFLIGQVIYM